MRGLMAVVAFIMVYFVPVQATVLAATPAFVQKKEQQINSGTTNLVTFTTSNTAGNLIVVYVIWDNNGSVSLSDSRGNTYVSAVSQAKYSGDRANAQIFYAKNIAGGTNTVKATFATAITAWGILYIHEYSGVDQISPVDAAVAASGSSSSMNSGNLAVSTPNTLLFAGGESNITITRAGSGYTVRSTGYGNITEDRIASTAGTYSATATQNGNAWVMQLVAFKAASGAPDTTPPSVPTNVQASGITSTSVTISWTASTDNVGVAGYKVFRNGTQVATVTSGTSYQNTSLTPNTTYAYTVSAYDQAGNNSAQSSPVSATTLPLPDTTPPSVPTNLVASGITSTTVTISWSASTDNVGVAGYKVFRNGTQVATVTSGTSYQNTSLTPNTAYAYTVSAYDQAGNNSAQSAPVNATTLPLPDTTPPSVPTNLVASGITSTTVTISWSASTDNVGVAGYKVSRDGYQIATTAQTSFVDTNLTPSTTYAYTVAAYDNAGNVSATSSPALNVTTTAGSILLAYPLKVSANGRYLVDQDNEPFLIKGDSPQGLIIDLSPSEADAFFANRAAYGFNAMWIHLLGGPTFGGRGDGCYL